MPPSPSGVCVSLRVCFHVCVTAVLHVQLSSPECLTADGVCLLEIVVARARQVSHVQAEKYRKLHRFV